MVELFTIDGFLVTDVVGVTGVRIHVIGCSGPNGVVVAGVGPGGITLPGCLEPVRVGVAEVSEMSGVLGR